MAELHPNDGTIRVVAFLRGKVWVAQCLEFDICAQAPTKDALEVELLDILKTHVAISQELGQKPFQNLPQAPTVFFEMYADSQRRIAEGRSDARPAARARGITPLLRSEHSPQLDIAFAC